MKKLLGAELVFDFALQGHRPTCNVACGLFLPGSGRAGNSFGERPDGAESDQVDRDCCHPCHG